MNLACHSPQEGTNRLFYDHLLPAPQGQLFPLAVPPPGRMIKFKDQKQDVTAQVDHINRENIWLSQFYFMGLLWGQLALCRPMCRAKM